MRTVSELQHLHAAGARRFGYVDITMFNCPPFVMFVNDNDCGICNAMLTDGRPPEPGSADLWARLLRPATAALDIGTRCGEYSLIAASLRPAIPVIACEPNPDAFARLQLNIAANDARNVLPKRIAAWDAPGYEKLSWYPKWAGHISSGAQLRAGDPGQGFTVVMVELARLDDVVKDVDLGPRPVMKIDVECAELRVFAGMQNILARRPDIILESFDQASCNAITTLTLPLGYRYYLIDEAGKKLIPRNQLLAADLKSGNFNQLLTARNPEEFAALMMGAVPG